MNTFASKALARRLVKTLAPRKPQTPEERLLVAALEERTALILAGKVTPQTVRAYVGDWVRFADYSQPATPIIQEGVLVAFSQDGEQVQVARADSTAWVYRLYLEVPPRPAGYVTPTNGPSVVLMKSPEWFG